jgi:hypothetical protein
MVFDYRPSENSAMRFPVKKHLVLVGAGHDHLTIMKYHSKVFLFDGNQLETNIIILATGADPSPIFNLGGTTGLLIWKSFVISGRIAVWFKNLIDRKFIRSFQISGELKAS